MAKLERKLLAHFVNVGQGTDQNYVRLGKDLETYAPEMSATVERTKNILGENSVVISGYEKSAEVTPYYAEEGDALFERLEAIIDGDLTLDALKVEVAEVKLWKQAGAETVFEAVRESAYLEVTSYGGDTTGVQIPFVIHYVGDKVKGTFDIATKQFAVG